MMDSILDRRELLKGVAAATSLAALPAFATSPAPVVPVSIQTRSVMGALPHIWEECVGSDRAAITLRESWRNDLERWKKEAGIKRVRFHGIFNDELGVYAPTILNLNKPNPNFQRIDQVYDGLIERGVSPFVELSFMPKALASGSKSFFFYGGNITPPKSVQAWADFVRTFVVHLVDRYGMATVKDWPFEVWNEPNLTSFWSGSQADYFDMYKATAIAIKSVDPRLMVGGPSTASIGWLPEFSSYCAQNNAPVDFFTTHIYAGDAQAPIFGSARYSQNDMIGEAMALARRQIDAGAFARKPLWLTEWSSDSPAMIAHVITSCLPNLAAMSQWALSSEFEELGVPSHVLKEGDSGWGMLTAGIAKPSFNTYKLLHLLGDKRLEATGPVLASQSNGKTIALVWNLADTKQPSGIPGVSHTREVHGEAKTLMVNFAGARPDQQARVWYVDQERGSAMPAWRAMGSPLYPRPDQLELLRRKADLQPPERVRLDRSASLQLTLPPEGVALIELV